MIRMNLVAVNQAASCKKLSSANNSAKNSATTMMSTWYLVPPGTKHQGIVD